MIIGFYFKDFYYKINHYNLKKILPSIIKQIDNICKEHKDEKGIIHTHTGFITSCLKNGLHGDRFLYKDTINDIVHIGSDSMLFYDSSTYG